MSAERLELSTNGLKGHCSAIELRAQSEEHSITLLRLRQQKRKKGRRQRLSKIETSEAFKTSEVCRKEFSRQFLRVSSKNKKNK